jgi:hypothetical protein
MKCIDSRGLIKLALWCSFFLYIGCSSSDDPGPVDCTTSDFALTFNSTNPTSCSANNGTITASVAGGEGPYQFALDANAFSSTPNFTGLGAGIYQLKSKDKNGCERSVNVTLNADGSNLAATVTVSTNSGCKTSNGSIVINASGGTGPYSFKINDGPVSSENMFGSLAAGNYTVKITDNAGCSITQSAKVLSGIKLSVEIKTIIDASCAVTGCHVSGGSAVSFTTLSNVISNASMIKSMTQNGTMPKGGAKLPQEQLNAIACWVDDGAPNN